MRKRKIMIFLLMGSLLVYNLSVESHAMGSMGKDTYSMIVYSSDVIILKMRTYKGKVQYRRWNDTKQCWVDPFWMDMP